MNLVPASPATRLDRRGGRNGGLVPEHDLPVRDGEERRCGVTGAVALMTRTVGQLEDHEHPVRALLLDARDASAAGEAGVPGDRVRLRLQREEAALHDLR